MATRYFIGTGNRNLSDSTNWSDISGGLSGFTVPTSSDDVFFDENSGSGIITINLDFSCYNITFTNMNSFTITGSVFLFYIYGSVSLSTGVTWQYTGTSGARLYPVGDQTFKSNGGVFFGSSPIIGGTGKYTFLDSIVPTTNIINVYNTLDFNDFNHSIRHIAFFAGSTAFLGNGTLTIYRGNLTPFSVDASANLHCEQSTIIIQGNSPTTTVTFAGGGKTYNIVKHIQTGIFQISGNNTFNTLEKTSTSTSNLAIYNNQIVNESLVLSGKTSNDYRLLIYSNSIGTPRIITCNGTITAFNVDFRDIIISGTTAPFDASAITGGSGDCGGNSGITFTTAQPQYYKHVGGGTTLWSDATKWFSDSGLTILGRVPLPQDDANFIAGSFTQACTLSVNAPRIGRSLDMSGVNQTVTMSLANNIECYGSYVLGGLIITSGSYAIHLHGRQIHDLNLYEKLVYNIELWGKGGTYVNQSNINCSGMISYVVCTFDFNDFNATLSSLMNLAYVGSTVILGNGILKSTRSSNLGSLFTFVNSFVQAEGSTIILEPVASASEAVLLQGGGNTFNKVIISGEYQGVVNIEGNTSFNELVIEKGKKVSFTSGTTKTIGKLTANGTPESPITITSTVTGTTHSLILTGRNRVNADYLNLSYSNVSPVNMWFAGLNSTNGNDNTGWIFDKAVYDARPFAYNPTHAIISGATLVGDISVGSDITDFSTSPEGMLWWNGPDEYPGYIIAYPVPSGDRSTPIGNIGTIGFKASKDLTETSFLELVKRAYGQTFANGADADVWLIANGYWSSFGRM